MDKNYADSLAAAYGDGNAIDHHLFENINRAEALSVQSAVMETLGETAGGFKVMINPEGKGTAAPFFASRVVKSGEALSVPARGVIGLEVEVALVLGKNITREMAEAGAEAVLEAVDHFVFGIEICATRFDDQKKATPEAQLADNLSGSGYIVGATPFTARPDIDGTPVIITADGKEIYNKPAKHPFGDALAPVIACALSDEDNSAMLSAGSLITTGSLCGAVAFSAPAEIIARIGNDHEVRVTLTA